MGTLHFVDSGDEVEIPEGEPIRPACKDHGVVFGCENGECGTCLIHVVEGKDQLQPPNDKELDFFGEPELETRLSCQACMGKGRVSIYQ